MTRRQRDEDAESKSQNETWNECTENLSHTLTQAHTLTHITVQILLSHTLKSAKAVA